MREFEAILLFCHLWKQWRLAGEALRNSAQYRDCHALLDKLEKCLGIAPIDALAALSIMIIRVAKLKGGQYERMSMFAKRVANRILSSSKEASTKHRTSLYADFLDAHASPLRTKFKQFSTDEYTTIVQGFVQRFADLHLHLHLSETAFQDPGLRPKPNRFSSSSSTTPTMLSTPRSSWSGYSSFTSLSRRVGLATVSIASDGQSTASGDRRSSTSSSSLIRRLSLSSSINGLHIGRSNSSVNVEPRDVVMEDFA
jgi:hypothetical protein